MSFKGKHVLITGAGRGLGAAFAVVMADQGAHVTIAGRNTENLKSLAESIRLRCGTGPDVVVMDLADISQVTLQAKKWRDDHRSLHILINNGAQWLSGKMEEHDAFAIASTIAGNVTGTLLLTRGVLPLLEHSGAGDIVNIVSVSGVQHAPMQGAAVAYIASKHAQTGMTDALRQELRGRPVRVTGIYPPNIMDISPLNEDQWNAVRPQASWVTNRDIVETVLFALSRPRHVTLSSILLESDTGNFFFN
jgi:NADP-dependent 3-hydroxy acid dehydrogenase YdfG